MNDAFLGTRTKKNDWTPHRRVAPAPVFVWPPKPAAFARWLLGYPGYIFGWNSVYLVIAAVVWRWATPSMATMADLAPGWIGLVLLRNLALAIVWYGAFHRRLYGRRRQETRFKYNGRWPSAESRLFSFGSQVKDNVFWSLASGVPMWTAYEVATMSMYANGHLPRFAFADHPIWFIGLFLLIPFVRELHFYWVHRMIHWPPIYKAVHSLHHRNTNPGPWSGLSMHPLEHLVYFSGVLFHWIVMSHPFHAMYFMVHTALAPVPGHTGFEKIEVGKGSIETGCWAHYLHHKHFEVNYADGMIPLDKWFGSFHDGSPSSDEALKQRRAAGRLANRPQPTDVAQSP